MKFHQITNWILEEKYFELINLMITNVYSLRYVGKN